MTQGEGLIGLLYAIKDILESSAILLITGFAVLAFFWVIVKYVGNKYGLFTGGGPLGGSKKIEGKNIVWIIFLLFVIFAIYSLIGLTASIFGLNSGPAGGLILR